MSISLSSMLDRFSENKPRIVQGPNLRENLNKFFEDREVLSMLSNLPKTPDVEVISKSCEGNKKFLGLAQPLRKLQRVFSEIVKLDSEITETIKILKSLERRYENQRPEFLNIIRSKFLEISKLGQNSFSRSDYLKICSASAEKILENRRKHLAKELELVTIYINLVAQHITLGNCPLSALEEVKSTAKRHLERLKSKVAVLQNEPLPIEE